MSAAAIIRPAFVPGVVDNMPADQYHASAALSSSGIKKLLRSPAHYVVERTKAAEPSEAMRIGTAVHTLLLEPARAGEVVEMPAFNNRTAAGREERDAWLAAHAGYQAFDADTLARIRTAVAAARAHPGASLLLSDGVAERSVFWRDAAEGIECRARFDWHRADGGIVDVKTTRDASAAEFSRAIASFGYAISAAHYWNGAEAALNASPPFWAFVAVEVEPPFGVACYVLDAASIRVGMRHCARAYRLFRECLQSNTWPAYPAEILPISLPAWALKFNEE